MGFRVHVLIVLITVVGGRKTPGAGGGLRHRRGDSFPQPLWSCP